MAALMIGAGLQTLLTCAQSLTSGAEPPFWAYVARNTFVAFGVILVGAGVEMWVKAARRYDP